MKISLSFHRLQQPALSRDFHSGGKLKADFVSQVESLDASRTGPFSRAFSHHRLRSATSRAGFVSSNELKRVLKQHGTELSLREMEALAMQVAT